LPSLFPCSNILPVFKSLISKCHGKNSIETSLALHNCETEIRFWETFGTCKTSYKASGLDEVEIVVLPLCKIERGLHMMSTGFCRIVRRVIANRSTVLCDVASLVTILTNRNWLSIV
jgi:hypothetical protein